MIFTPAQAGQFQSAVINNTTLSKRYFLLTVTRPAGLPEPAPGQFVQLAVPDASRFFLRRPFSIFDCTDQTLNFLILELGSGTQVIRKFQKGDKVDFYGPLGNSFPQASGQKILAVAGGVGLAPLYFYGYGGGKQNAGHKGGNYRLLYGGRTKEDLFLDYFDMKAEGISLSTDDGSFGFAGNVVEMAERELQRDYADVIFACGPTVMLKALGGLAAGLGITFYASLENRMGCGMGACRACVVPTRSGGESPYKTVCHDGPVFDAADLIWDELPVP